jgi:hypothetical protein
MQEQQSNKENKRIRTKEKRDLKEKIDLKRIKQI